MRLLFVKQSLAWPRSSGHDVHSYNMMRSLASLGAEVWFASVTRPSEEAIRGVALTGSCTLSEDAGGAALTLNGMRGRFASYFGVDPALLGALQRSIARTRPDAVVVVGLEMLPYLAAVPSSVTRVWYAADEWVWHHLSRVRADKGRRMRHLQQAVIKGTYERAFAACVDRVWVVSDLERRAARWFGGMRHADVLPNGVDAAYYTPGTPTDLPDSAVFWGRLDFGPNVEALRWLVNAIWPAVRARVPGASLSIIGFAPGDDVRRLAQAPGITLHPDVEDLRPIVARHAVVVLPFVSGGGIKNKLLEAAALGKPVICTRHARSGVRAPEQAPFVTAETPTAWVDALEALWRDPAAAAAIGARTRGWVIEHHSWTATARDALAALASQPRAERRALGKLTTR